MKVTSLDQKSVEIMRQCPRFDRCQVPVCPLDLLQDNRAQLRGEAACTLSKARRHRIGKNTWLPRQGLTKREWAAHVRWQGLPESERKRRTAGLRPFRPVVHGAQSLKQKDASSDVLVMKASRKAAGSGE